MSRIDLNANREHLLRAHKEVSDPKSKTDWALYGYEGKTNVLKLVEKGDGGIEELVDELSSGKIMYAYCKVKDPNSNLPKCVLINWQGEGVQEMRKGSCANHFLDVSNFLRGAHLTVHARTEDDIDEEEILNKVAKSSGSNYGFHKEKARPEDSAPTGPVGSVYKKTLPHAEIKMSARDKFWEKTQDDEKRRQTDDSKTKSEERAKADRDTKEREAREGAERESKENERMKKVRVMREAERRASETDNKDQEQWEKSQSDALQDEEERRKRSDQLRRERAAEAKALVSKRDNNPRSVFEHQTSQFDEPEPTGGPGKGPPPPRKIKHSFMDEPQAPAARKQPIQLPTEDESSSVPSRPWEPKQEDEPAPAPKTVAPSKPARHSVPREPSPPPREPSPPPREPSPPPRREPSPPPKREPSPPPRREPSPPRSAPVSQTTAGQPKTRNLLAEGMPKRQLDSDEEEDNDDWGEDESTPVPVAVTRTEPAPAYGEDELYDDAQTAPVTNYPPEEVYDDAQSNAPQAGLGGEKGVVARALYDYQAAEENEISFDPDDLITNIDMIDQGWWIGFGPDGRQGMFPANYVEVINS